MPDVQVLLAVQGPGETDLVSAISRAPGLTVSRRCGDVAELLAAAGARLGTVAVVSASHLGIDRVVVDRLRQMGVLSVGLAAPEDTGRVAALGVDAVVDQAGGTQAVPVVYNEARTEAWGAPSSVAGSLVMKDNVAVYGGFEGYRGGAGKLEANRRDRNRWQNLATIAAPAGAHHVVVFGKETAATVNSTLDGFMIQGGNAAGLPGDYHTWRGGGPWPAARNPAARRGVPGDGEGYWTISLAASSSSCGRLTPCRAAAPGLTNSCSLSLVCGWMSPGFSPLRMRTTMRPVCSPSRR